MLRKERFEKSSLKSQLLMGYLLPVVLFSVIFIIIVFAILWKRTSVNIYNAYNNNITQLNFGITEYVTKLDNGMLNFYNDKEAMEYLRAVTREVLYEDAPGYEPNAPLRVRESLSTLLNLNIDMNSISLVNMKGEVQTVHKHGVLPYTLDFRSNYYDELRESYGELVVLEGTVRENLNNSQSYVVTAGRRLIDSGNPNSLGTYVGYIIIEFEVDAINELVGKYNNSGDFYIEICDENGEVIDFGNIGKTSPETSRPSGRKLEQENLLCDWTIRGVIGQEVMLGEAQTMGMPLLFLVLGSIVIIIVISIYISNKIVRPIKELQLAMEQYKKADDIVTLPLSGSREITQLGSVFSDMTQRIRRQTLALAEAAEEKKEMQIKMLYSQIKPHFLYNTLESIRMMALLDKNEQLAKAIKALAELLRYNTSEKIENVKICEEVAHMQNYFLLQKLRMGDKVDLRCEIEEGVLESKMIPFVLQPLVENSIKHGFKGRHTKGQIEVKAWKEESIIRFSVNDNGCGMTEQQIKEVYHATNYREHGIGLTNIKRRLELIYGTTLEILSMEGQGVTIKFEIPEQKEEHVNDASFYS